VLGFFSKGLADTAPEKREMLLAAVPLRNELVRETAVAGGLRLTAPLRESAMRRVFAGKNGAGITREKSFELDDLGTWVWRQMNGRQTVEGLIEAFAGHFRVNLREAEVAVVAFLKTLTQRNLIGLAAPKH
jgi:hypothetical protein